MRERFCEGGEGEMEKGEGWDFLEGVAEGVLQVGVADREGTMDVGGLWAKGEIL